MRSMPFWHLPKRRVRSFQHLELDTSASPMIKCGIKNRLVSVAMKGMRRYHLTFQYAIKAIIHAIMRWQFRLS